MVNMTLSPSATPVASSSKLSAIELSAPIPSPVKSSLMANGHTSKCPKGNMVNGTQDEQAPHILNSLSLHLQTDPKRGRGVYAHRRLAAYTLIEKAPTLLFSADEYSTHDLTNTLLGSYTFTWQGGSQALCLGLGSLFNHSPNPNVSFKKDARNGLMEFWTSRTIEQGEELNICYSADESKLWFKPDYAEGQEQTEATREEEEVDPMTAFLNNLSDADDEIIVPIANPKRGPDGARINSRPKEESRKERARSKRKPLPATVLIPDEAASETPTRSTSQSSSSVRAANLPVPLPAPILSDLPPPLHSTGGKELGYVGGSADLVDPLDFDEAYWAKRAEEGEEDGGWDEIERIKGNVDAKGKSEDFDLVNVCVVKVMDPKLTHPVLQSIKHYDFEDVHLRHLKRVRRIETGPDGKPLDPPENYVLVCDESEVGPAELKQLLSSFRPALASLEPYVVSVPTRPARTQEELPTMTAIWPVTFSPWRNKPEDERQWTAAKKAWVRAGIMRVLSEAVVAGEAGELPSAVHCTAAPPCVQPQEQGFILPTPDMRASACDMRRSQGHPLRHAAMSCIASIARLRTVPPFSTVNPTRNGADYLLTSLSLFASHEPCVMCAMALLHSRVREVFYVFPRTVGGGLGGVYGVHGHQGLNHKFEVWRWTGAVEPGIRDKLVIDDALDL